MAQHKPTALGLALVFFVVTHSIEAIDKCKSGCNGASGPLKFTQGTTYKYDYDGKINITVCSADGQATTTEVKATVLLTQQADCSQLLRIQNVQIVGPDGKKRIGVANIEKPVVLNNNNGALNEFICAEDGDTQDSLNLKRAIASFFQVNQEKNSEIDVFGQCPTQISHYQDGDVVTITKSKNLNRCAFRESLAQNYITSTFNIQSEIRSTPILNSNMDSKQKIKDGILDSASIVENYLFVPFSVGNHGAKAAIESKITLTGTSKDNPSTKCQIPKSIIFENPHMVNTERSNINTILKKIKDTSENIGVNVGEQTTAQFIELIKLLRVSKKADVLSVYNQIRSGSGFSDREGAKKLFLDAILVASNGDNIEVAVELLKNKELSPLEEKQFYLSLSHVRHPTIGSISTATDLLNRPKLPREAYLGVGSLAGRYCSTHSCDKLEVVEKLIQKLLGKLGDFKAANRKEESDMIYILKGLTNIGYLNDAIISKLITLAEDKKQSVRLRISALDTFSSAPCKDKFIDSALKTVKDIQQDSEIRIKAYLFLTICPNAKVGNAVKAMLDTEKSNQVGGFIASHIKNLRSSVNPEKLLAKTHLGFIHTPTRFKFDPRKYSFNGEFSYNIDALGLGNNIEGNVIYSQSSWLPRSTSLNLTAEVFGQRFNFLEIIARQENLDRIIEHYLGPQGVLRKATLQQNWDSAVKPMEKLWKNIKEKVDKSLRARRDISKSEIDAINKKVSMRTNYLDRNLDLDLSVKTFGSEVLFMNSFDTTEHVSLQGVIDNLVAKLNAGLDKLKNFENTLRSNLLLIDAELGYPTSLGFPLRLTLDAATNIQLKTSGNIDIRELVAEKENKDLNLKISVIPSVTVTVTGKFSFDTPLLENGLKVTSTLHTSTGGELLVNSFKKGHALDVKFKIPIQKQELINLKHDIIFQSRENGVPIKDQRLKFTQNKDFSICIDHLMNFIGLEFCAAFFGPNLSGKKVPILPFPLSGDAKAVITIERGDIDTFHYRREIFSQTEGKIGVEATIETLGPNNKKGVSLTVEGYISPDKYIKATLNSPIKNAQAEARLVSNDNEKLIALTLKDENKLYSAKAGLHTEDQGDKSIFKPILEYTTPEHNSPQTPPVHVEGKVIREKNGGNVKFIIDNLKIVIPNRKSVTLKGKLGNEGPAYYTDISVTDGDISGSLKGRLQVQHSLLKIHTEFENSINPNLNLNINGEFKREGKELISSNLQIVHGPDLKSKKNVITSINIFKFKNPKEMELSIKNKFSYPAMKISTKLDFERTPKSLSYDAYLHYGEAKLGSDLKLITNSKAEGDYHLELGVESMKNKIEVKSSRQVLGHHDSKISNSISINGKKLEVHGKLKHFLRMNNINVAADLVIKTPNSKTPFKLSEGLKLNSRELDFHVKLLSGNNPLIDTTLKTNRVGNINGHMKVNIKEIMIVNGQIKAQEGVGSGNIVIEAKSLKKTAKAETSFTIQEPTFNIDVTLYPMFNEDKNKKIILSTKNKIINSDVDSASTLDVFGSKSSLNLKAHIASMTSGKTTVDAGLTLPEGQLLTANIVRDITPKGKLWNSDTVISLEHKNDKNSIGRKLTIKEVVKDTVLGEGIFDINLSIAADDAAGHNINIDGNVKRQRNGEQWEATARNKITASFLEHPIETDYNAVLKNSAGNFNFKSSFCPKSEIQLEGKYDFEGKSSPISGNVNVALKLPFETLSNLNTSNSFSFVKGQEGTQASLAVSSSLVTSSSIPNLNIDTKSNLKVQRHKNVGNAMYHVEINSPIKTVSDISAGYNIDSVKKENSVMGDFKSVLPNNQIFQVGGSLMAIGRKEFKAEGTLELPTESFKSNKLYIHNKRVDDLVTSEAKLTSDGQTYDLNTNLNLNSKEPSLNIKLTRPNGKITQITANAKRPSSTKFEANFKHICQEYDYLLEAGLDVNSESLNDFSVKMTANSPNLNIKDVILKIGNAGSSDSKTINVEITSEGKNVVAGSVTVSSREENEKYIIEGSGNFKVENKDTSGNFKYIRTSLFSTDKNGESGEILSFDGSLGNKAIDAEIKLTNKEFRYSNSYCEESKQCAHVEIGILNTLADFKFHNEIEVSIDLRKLGVPNEFGLKAVTRTQDYLLDHTVDVHFENAANKYQYTLFVHPKEFGISFTTPKRIISLEATVEIPTNGVQNGGKVSGEVTFYTDKKNNPTSKSFLKGLLDIDLQNHLTNGELNMNIVGQNKPYMIKYTEHLPSMNFNSDGTRQLILDIFAKPDQKIVIDHKYSSQILNDTFKVLAEETIDVESKGWGIDVNIKGTTSLDAKALTWAYEDSASVNIGGKKYDSVIKLALSTKEGYILIKHLNQVILEAKSDINLQKGQVNIDTHTSGLGITPYETIFEVKNYNSLKFTQYHKDNPNTKLFISASLIPKQIAEVRADNIVDGNKRELFHASLNLDEKNFLHPNVAFQGKNVEAFIAKYKEFTFKHLETLSITMRDTNQKVVEDFQKLSENAKEAIPDSRKTVQFYGSELSKFKDELAADKTLQIAAEFIKNIIITMSATIAKIMNILSGFVENIVISLNNAFSNVLKSIQEELLPKLKEIADRMISAVQTISNQIFEVLLSFIVKIGMIIEYIQPQLKAIATSFSEAFEDVVRFVYKTYEGIKNTIAEQIQHILHELKASSGLDNLKSKYRDFLKDVLPSQEVIVNTIRAMAGMVNEVILIPEFQTVNNLVEKYLEKKITQQPVDDIAELDKIVRTLSDAVAKFVLKLSKELLPDIARNLKIPPINLDLLRTLPRSLGDVRVSLWEYFIQEDTNPLYKYLITLPTLPHHLSIPPSLIGIIVGAEVYTFDQDVFYFPGTCNYLLARDAVNGNFSLIGSFENNQIAGITFSDKSGTITIRKDKILMNYAEANLPIVKGGLRAYRFNSRYSIISSAGVVVDIELNLSGSSITVSGFYHGQLRGLFGNGNHESFDDLALPNGRICNSISELGQAYSIGSASECTPVKVTQGPSKPNPKCDKIFDWDSSFRRCYPFVNHELVKRGCELSSAGGNENAYWTSSITYNYYCWKSNIPVKIPTHIISDLQCKNSLVPHKTDERFSVKLNGKSADVLLVLSSNKINEVLYKNFIQPLVGNIVKEFAAKGIDDVEFHILLYGGEHEHPGHVTIGGKLTFKGEAPNISFSDGPKPQKLKTGWVDLDKVISFFTHFIYEVKWGLGLFLSAESFADAMQYPFRAEARRSVIVVSSDPCEAENLRLLITRSIFLTRKDISLSVISPIQSLKVKDIKTTKDVIGFNSENVITLSGSKAHPAGSPTLMKDLNFNDLCLDYALSTGGKVYPAENLFVNTNSKSEILQVIAQNIAADTVNKDIELDCVCETSYRNPFVPINVCSVIEAKEKGFLMAKKSNKLLKQMLSQKYSSEFQESNIIKKIKN